MTDVSGLWGYIRQIRLGTTAVEVMAVENERNDMGRDKGVFLHPLTG